MSRLYFIRPTKRRGYHFLLSLASILTIVFPVYADNSCHLEDINIEITVIDGETSEPLIGVTIYTDDNRMLGMTDFEGKATIGDLGHREMVNFAYLGYITQKLPFFQLRKTNGLVRLFTSNLLDSIVVVGRRDDPIEEIPYVVERISSEQIAFSNAQTAADILASEGGLFVQKTQMGGGSPVIRGFEANKVLLVLDGVRLNNAIYRNGHLQNAITIDNAMLEQVEVIYGPGSLMYGSEALGGVIHYRSKEPKVLFGNDVKDYNLLTNAYTRFASANKEKSIHLDFDYRSRRWGSITSFTFSDFGHLRAGSRYPEGYEGYGEKRFYVFRNENVDEIIQSEDPNIQVGTAYSQIDFLQKVRYQPSETLYFILNFQYSTSSDVPRYDNLTDTIGSAKELAWSEWYYGPQKRLLASLKTRVLKSNAIYDKGTFIAAFQKIDEDRLKRKWNKVNRTFNLEDVYVGSFTADFDKELDGGGRNLLSYGLDVSHNYVQSEAGNLNINTGRVIYNVLTRYPNEKSTMSNLGAYINYRWRSRDSTLTFHAGGRYSYVQMLADFQPTNIINWPQSYIDGLPLEKGAPTWGAGLTWNSKSQWQVRLLAATAFRSPNIDDFTKIRVKSSRYITFPNPELTPEYSRNMELTIAKTIGRANGTSGSRFKLSATGFYTQIQDVIVRKPGIHPNGVDRTILIDEVPHDIQQNFNEDNGYIYGFSGNLRWDIGSKWTLKSGLNYTKGRVEFKEEGIDTLVPMAHIPPLYGQSSLGFKSDRFQFETVVRYNGPKPIQEFSVNSLTVEPRTGYVTEVNRGGTSDNVELSGMCVGAVDDEVCEGTLAWTTLNFYMSYKFNEHIGIDLALENAMDLHYRLFSSTVSAAGRNFIIALRGKF
ncbi:MAG: TonB-dependent receptor [Bacteroidota bacterium]